MTIVKSKWCFSRPAQITLLAGVAAVLVIAAAPIELAVLSISQRYSEWLNHWSNSHAWATLSLPALAFGGGLIASISPCVLALLPVQLSYLGAHQQQHPNPGKVLQFCLGVVTAYSLLGLFTSLAGTLLIDHRGVLLITAGVIVICMALQLKGWGPLIPWDRLNFIPTGDLSRVKQLPVGAFVIGFTFALATSPCASPVLAAVVSISAANGSPLLATAAMVSYAIGYSMVILLAGLGMELGGLRHQLLSHSTQVSGISAMILFSFGVIYVWSGFQTLQLIGYL